MGNEMIMGLWDGVAEWYCDHLLGRGKGGGVGLDGIGIHGPLVSV